MNYNMYSLEQMAHEINTRRMAEAKNYRLWQKARKASKKPTK